MSDRVISQANLNAIESNLNAIHRDLTVVDDNLGTVNDNVKVVYDEIGGLARDFHEYVLRQEKVDRLQRAETRLIKIRQELDKKYGHYDVVRRSATAILQADDLGLVKKETINTATEEMMIQTPGYWLAPCLVALAAWIDDQPELADKAVAEAMRRDSEKTSLLFALICRRADRKNACVRWVERYLEFQDPEDLGRETIIILDAYASGLFGADTEGVIARQIENWIHHLENQSGFTEMQTQQWADAINLKKKPIDESKYPYLKQYSKTYSRLMVVLEGAYLHAEMFSYLTSVFEKTVDADSLKEQLDEILNNLVTGFDDEELPLRKEEKFEQFVVDFEGDEDRARQNMAIEQTAFEEKKDFTQLLTDAAMKPESSHSSASTQKFAFAMSKEWVTNAYNDIVAKNRFLVPNEIEINVDTFNDKTVDGRNETELLGKFENLVEEEKRAAFEQCKMNVFEKYCLYGGIILAAVGVGMAIAGSVFLGVIAIIIGLALVLYHFAKKSSLEKQRQNLITQFQQKRENGLQIIRATLAEVVDYREEFSVKDAESVKVLDYLEQIRPEEYVRKLGSSSRKIRL